MSKYLSVENLFEIQVSRSTLPLGSIDGYHLFAAPEGDLIVIEDRHLDDALHELIFVGGALTKSLLGFSQTSDMDTENDKVDF